MERPALRIPDQVFPFGGIAFSVTALAVVSFSVSPYALDPEAKAAFLWIVLFFSAMSGGLSRSFVREEETRTALALRLSASADAVYVGKLLST